MNLTNKLLILLALTGISFADNVCETSECVQTANLIKSSINDAVDPCDDFYQYSCGTWIKNNPLTAANANTGVSHFLDLNRAMLKNLLNMLTQSSTSTDPKYIHPLINFFKGCVNSNERDLHEKQDFIQINAILKRLGGWPILDDNWDEEAYDIENAFIELNKAILAKILLSVEISRDITNNSQHIIYLTNPFGSAHFTDGIWPVPGPKPEPDYREGIKDFAGANYYAENPVQSIADALKGEAVSATQFQKDMTASQTMYMKVASIYTPINNMNYIFQNFQKYKIHAKDLSQFTGLNYRKIIDGILKAEGTQLNDNDIIFADKEFLTGLGQILNAANKRAIANIIGVNIATILSRFSSTKLMALAGIPSVQLLPQICVSFSSQILPDLLGRQYMDKLFSKETTADMKVFITSLKEAFNELLNENKWMDSTTKANAIKKLNAISEHIAFPDYSFDTAKLAEYHKVYANFSEKTFLTSMITAAAHQRSINTRQLRNPEPVGHWPAPANAIMINAFYNPEFNGIFFPAGIAQFPFYQHTRPTALNLGAIGMVISHELTHAFDNLGSLFDEKGNLHNWFDQSTKTVFNEKAQCFVKQYSKFKYPTSTGHVYLNGQRTLGENIADNGGVRIAYRALQLYKQKNAGKLSKLPGTVGSLSEEKLFFLSFANLWCSHRPATAIQQQIAMDPHSIEDARVIGTLANFPEFGKAFNCAAGTPMNPTERCVLWG